MQPDFLQIRPSDETHWPTALGRSVAMVESGLVFGAGTVLARMTKGGGLALDQDRERLLALLSVADRRLVSSGVLGPIEAAAGHWQRGDKALANLRLVFSGLPQLKEPADAWRVRLAEILLDAGLPPRILMAELKLDPAAPDLDKFGYNPNQPRVPAGNGRASGQWEAIWNRIISWLDEPVPEYDQDDGTEVGTRTRGRAIATNPLTIGIAGTVALLGGEAVVGATVGAGAAGAGAEEAVTIAAATRTLPPGMSRTMFGDLAGFVQGQVGSSQASTAASAEILNNLKAAGVTRESVSAFQRFYQSVANRPVTNLAAVHRAKLLSNILRVYK